MFQKLWDHAKKRPAHALCVAAVVVFIGTAVHMMVARQVTRQVPRPKRGTINKQTQELNRLRLLWSREEGIGLVIASALLTAAGIVSAARAISGRRTSSSNQDAHPHACDKVVRPPN